MLNKRILVLIFLLVFLPLVGCFPSPAPPITENQAPIITSIPITSVTVGETYVYDVKATDPDGDTLTYSLSTKPTGMTIGPATGLIKWTPKAKGNYAVTVKVSDGALSDTQSFTIVVSKPSAPPPVNHAPIIASIPDLATIVGIQYIYEVKATDPDGDVLTYSLTVKPDGMVIGSATGKITWIPDATGSFGVTVNASDGKLSDTQSFTITVSAVELTSIVVDPKTMTLFVGETEAIKSVTAHYSDGSTFVIDQQGYDYGSGSSDETIATVDVSGLVTAVAKGTTTITVGYVDKTDTIEVTVNPIRLTSIVVLPETMTLFVGEFEAIKSVTAHYNDGTKAEIKLDDCIYESSDTSVTSVDTSGTVTAIDDGEATITLSYTEEEITKTVYIEETDTVEVKVIRKVHNVDADKYYNLIQVAINEALTGDTIEVAAGIYNEIINIPSGKDGLKILGHSKADTFISGDLQLYSPVTISGFNIKAPGIALGSTIQIASVGASGESGNPGIIEGNTISGNFPIVKGFACIALNGSVSWWEIKDNEFTASQTGIAFNGASNILVSGNTFSGYLAGCGSTEVTSNVTISGNQFLGSETPESEGIGIATSASDLTITNNTITGNYYGIKVYGETEISTVHVNYNNISGNTNYGIEGSSNNIATLDATNNWWGDESGPTHSANPGGTGDIVSDNVDFSPFSESPH